MPRRDRPSSRGGAKPPARAERGGSSSSSVGTPIGQELIGELVDGRYRLASIIGQGGMGVVYSAMDVDSGDYAAVKVLHPTAHSAENLKRFRRETRAAFSLHHPNVCRVFGSGTLANGAPYIAMEFLSGETLRRRLSDEGPFSLSDTIAIALQLLDGLSAAHARGVLHRDVKPGNVFLTSKRGQAPVVKLIDFGLAKLLPGWSYESTPEDASAITKTGFTPGTPHYLSPEQIDGTRDLDERADVWAMGLVLYEMFTGSRPFSGESYQVLAAAIALQTPAGIRSRRSDVPPELEKVILSALAKQRRHRYRNAPELRAALVECWARIRAEGIARGTAFARGRAGPAPRGASIRKAPASSEMETDPHVPTFADSSVTQPTLRLRRPKR